MFLFYKSINNTSYEDITYQINKTFIGKNIDKTILKKKSISNPICCKIKNWFYIFHH